MLTLTRFKSNLLKQRKAKKLNTNLQHAKGA